MSQKSDRQRSVMIGRRTDLISSNASSSSSLTQSLVQPQRDISSPQSASPLSPSKLSKDASPKNVPEPQQDLISPRDPTKRGLFSGLPMDATVEEMLEIIEVYNTKIEESLNKLGKVGQSQITPTFTPEQYKYAQELLDKYPKTLYQSCYNFGGPSEISNEINTLKEQLYFLDQAIYTFSEHVNSPYVLPYSKRQPIPEFVFKINNNYNVQTEVMILKIQIRRSYYELFSLIKTMEFVGDLDKVKAFNEKVDLLSESLKRMKEKIANEKRTAFVKLSMYTDSKGIETDDKGNVLSGPIEALVRWLVNPNIDNNIKFIEAFLVTYRQYLKPTELFEKLVALYHENKVGSEDKQRNEIMHKTVLVVVLTLCKWMAAFPHDFLDQCDKGIGVLPRLDEFIKENEADPLITGKIVTNRKMMVETAMDKKTIEERLDIVNVKEDFTIATLPIEQFAHQLTLYEFEMFKAIEAKEMLGNAWTKPDKTERSPNLCMLIDHFNSITNWVISTIVDEPSVKQRGVIVKKFVSIGEELLRINNYNGVFEFFSGLNSTPVGRLKQTWEKVGTFSQIMQSLERVTVPTGSYQVYRADIKAHQNFPCIPFFGVYLQDLTFIHEGNEDKKENGDVNFEKCSLTTKVIEDMLFYKRKYEYYRNPEILAFIRKLNVRYLAIGEKELYDKSLIIEPRQQGKAKKK
ncbi:guanine nucleotide exchange factor, putative [Entamoeba invadens IP1]|uniref:guanine nucleotide exchange factor, putative n=1 Tax=Entamoeba invadens IP1 TaxID=370355 RepID=UPI0002C3E311|nr:guanine nucleotide exchange factor, putative [Entamoeba invadens IP1]ELP85395.1 guanine nucleotide exchange factor, putative [Entamoeba invadens IP1]|eukprot:XP_004184741.1 guanine nucleotide exchange factor, putative [Entamoeba invadens IP1]